jgi:hypothetical protein
MQAKECVYIHIYTIALVARSSFAFGLRQGSSLADSFGPKVNLAQVGGGLSSSTSEQLYLNHNA